MFLRIIYVLCRAEHVRHAPELIFTDTKDYLTEPFCQGCELLIPNNVEVEPNEAESTLFKR